MPSFTYKKDGGDGEKTYVGKVLSEKAGCLLVELENGEGHRRLKADHQLLMRGDKPDWVPPKKK